MNWKRKNKTTARIREFFGDDTENHNTTNPSNILPISAVKNIDFASRCCCCCSCNSISIVLVRYAFCLRSVAAHTKYNHRMLVELFFTEQSSSSSLVLLVIELPKNRFNPLVVKIASYFFSNLFGVKINKFIRIYIFSYQILGRMSIFRTSNQ